MAAPSQKPKSQTIPPKPAAQKPVKKSVPPKPVLVLEDDIPIPPPLPPDATETDADRSISIYPATVSTFVAEIRPPTPGIEEIREKLKVNYNDFGFRLNEKLRETLKTIVSDVEAKERVSADLDQEIATRRRVAAAAQASFSVADEDFLRNQVKARDRQIVILSDRLFDVITKGKLKPAEEVKAKERVIAALQTEIESLNAAVKQRDDTIAEISDKEKAKMFELELDNERLSVAVENRAAECETAKSRINQSEKLLLETKNDLLQQTKIVTNLVNVNKELNEKMRKLTEEIEGVKGDNFELRVKQASVERLEGEIESLTSNRSMYEKQFEKLAKVASNAEAEKVKSKDEEDYMRQECIRLADLMEKSANLLILGSGSEEEKTDSVEKFKEEMIQIKGKLEELPRHSSQIPSGTVVSTTEKVKLKVATKDSELEITNLKEAMKTLENSKQLYETRVKSLEADISILKSDFSTSLSAKDSDLMQAKDLSESLQTQLNRLVEQAQEREVAVSKANLHISSLNQKLEAQKAALEVQFLKANSAKKQSKALSEQVAALNRQISAKEKEIAYRDKSFRELSQKLKVMEVELWNKDSDLLVKEAKIVELQEENAALRLEIDQFGVILRKTVAEQLSEINAMLEDKSNQIDLLKNMLRSSQTQVKQKDVDIQRYKLKSDKLPLSEAISPHRVPDLKSPKSSFPTETREAINHFASQIERLRKFSSSKLDKIAAAEADGSLNSAWLKEELKLSKPPSDLMSAQEVLRLSVEQRVNSLLLKVQTACESGGGDAEEAVRGLPGMGSEKWEGLVETLRKYSSKVLGRE